MSSTPDIKEDSPLPPTELPLISEVKNEETNDEDSANELDASTTTGTGTTRSTNKKRRKGPAPGKKPSAEVLQRRREGRIKAAATIAHNLKKTGIGRFEDENGFGLTSVKAIPLINQKNYFTDYLKKDEQVSFIRNWRTEKLVQQKLKTLKKDNSEKKDESGEIRNFDDFNLNEIEAEMNKKKALSQPPPDEEEDEEEEEEIEETSEEKAKQGYDTIVIHPGSSHIRIGRATDAFPKTVPTVIALPTNVPASPQKKEPIRTVNDEDEVFFNEEFDVAKGVVTKDFKARMRYYKRRILPNSRETAANYNKKQTPEMIPDHNDPYQKNWITEVGESKFFIGEDALKLPICEKFNGWKLRYPLKNGKFNESSADYRSPQEILGDLAYIITESLNQMDIKNLENLKAILIIPDLYDKLYVESWVELLFKVIGFGRVGIIQEAVSATFGAGASSACIVDVGAQTTSIACVDEGMVINDSRITLNYGGDDITKAFIKLLLQSQFPYKDIDLGSKNDDWELAQTLKHDFITFQDADIAVQLYNFYKRKPFETTQKYEFKVFDEVMLAPMGLFYPELFQIKNPSGKKKLFSPSVDQYSGKPNNPYSKSQENLMNDLIFADLTDEDLLVSLYDQKSIKSNPYAKPKPTKTSTFDNQDQILATPLEKAIVESITNAGISTDFSKAKKFYDNLLVVGGGFSKIAGFDLILSDRINIWRPKYLSSSALDEILEYVAGEKAKSENIKKNLIDEYKESERTSPDQNVDEIEIPEEKLEEFEEASRISLNLEYLDSISEKGSILSVNVLPPPREFDPEMLTWKGGSVYGRLKVVNEMWITQKDWDLLQSRCLYYKSLFNY